MHSPRLEELFLRYCNHNVTEAERQELMGMLLLEENRAQVNALIDDLIRRDASSKTMSTEVADEILHAIFSASGTPQPAEQQPEQQEGKTRKLWLARLAAASVALLVMYGGYEWLGRKQKIAAPAQSALVSVYGEDFPAGGNKAELTLADGQTVNLATITSGSIAGQPGMVIDKIKGQVSYNRNGNTAAGIAYNTLKTPLGGQYSVVLPDGSRAWLNAGSTLRYPTVFAGNSREVEMTGEIYFEIEPDKARPFHVQVLGKADKDLGVTVLGTHFNICSYGDEPATQATLLEGSVKVEKGSVTKILSPGQQARVLAKDIAVKEVDTETVVAWKEGRFEFNGNIKQIMRQIARWYDLDVYYEGNVDKKAFAGTISRRNNVSEVLKMLELTGGIQFRIEDRKITVKNID